MRKILFLLVCACTLVSCNQDNEMFVEEDQTQSVLESDSLELRSVGEFFDPSNLTPLYEYAAFSGGTLIDTYYTTENKGTSFYDPQCGRTFLYQGSLGKVGKAPLPYRGIYLDKFVYKIYLRMYSSEAHEILSEPYYFPDDDAYGKTCNIGYAVFQTLPEDWVNYENGTWKWLYKCLNNYNNCFRYFALSPYEKNPPSGWRVSGSMGAGIIVTN